MLELDKPHSGYGEFVDIVRAAGPERTKKPGWIRRRFSARRYDYRFEHGAAVDRTSRGFGFDNGRTTFFIRSQPRAAPPVDEKVLLVTGTLTHSSGRPVGRRQPVLLGYAGSETGVVYAKANWAQLHGRPVLKWALLLALFAVVIYFSEIGRPDPSMAIFFLSGPFFLLYLPWLPVKLWQVSSARYDFRAHVSQLHRYLEE